MLFIVGFEMGLEVTQGVDARAAALAQCRSLFGCSNRHLLEHGRK